MTTPLEALENRQDALALELGRIQLELSSLEHRIAANRRRGQVEATRHGWRVVMLFTLVNLARLAAGDSLVFLSEN